MRYLTTEHARILVRHAVKESFNSNHPDPRFYIGAALYTGPSNHFDETQIITSFSGIPHRLSPCISGGETISGHGPTTHAEMRLLHHHTGKSLAITDPPCPDCMNGVTVSNVDEIYIHDKGFGNQWYANNHSFFAQHSLRIAQAAGIRLFIMGTEDDSIPLEIPNTSPQALRKSVENIAFPDNTLDLLPPEILLRHAVALGKTSSLGNHFNGAIAIGRNDHHQLTALSAVSDLPAGMTNETASTITDTIKRIKYMLPVQAVKALMIKAPAAHVSLDGGTIYSRYLPPANVLIDCVDSGITRLFFADLHSADPYDYPHSRTNCTHEKPAIQDAIECMNFLKEHNLVQIEHIPVPE